MLDAAAFYKLDGVLDAQPAASEHHISYVCLFCLLTGGATSLLALNGLFRLIHVYNL